MIKKIAFLTAFALVASFPSFAQKEVNYDFPEDKWDFGVLEEGVMASHEFNFTNAGKDSIDLKREHVRPSCGCTTPKLTEGSIAPKASGKITAEYNTMGRVSKFIKSIHIFDGDNHMVKDLTIKGIVIKKDTATYTPEQLKKSPKTAVNPSEHHFGKIEKNQAVTYKVKIKNEGKSPLTISSGDAACSCVNYKIVSDKDNAPITEIAHGKSAVLEITYTPQSTGKNRDVFTLFTNDLSNPRTAIILYADVVESLIERSPVQQQDQQSPFHK